MPAFRKITIGALSRSKKPNAKVVSKEYYWPGNSIKYRESVLELNEGCQEMEITLSTGQKIRLNLWEAAPGQLFLRTDYGNIMRVAPSRSDIEEDTEVKIKTLNMLEN